MANLFAPRSVVPLSPRDRLLRRYRTAQVNLYIVAVFTLVNVITAALFISDSYFLFSAFVPYDMVISALIFCGKLPPEFYTEMGMEGMTFLPEGIFIGATVVAVVIAGLYLLFGLLSKKKVGWMIAALVVYGVDTFWILFNYGIDISFALDYLFHIWVIVSLSMGIAASYRMKTLPEEVPETVLSAESDASEGE